MPVGIVDATVGSMLRFVDAVGVDTEKWVWQPTVAEGGGIGEEEWNEETTEGEDDAEAEGTEAVVYFVGGYDATETMVNE